MNECARVFVSQLLNPSAILPIARDRDAADSLARILLVTKLHIVPSPQLVP